MIFIYIELFYYDNFYAFWTAVVGVIALISVLSWRFNKVVEARKQHDTESLKIKRPQSPIEQFIEARDVEIRLRSPTMEERIQLLGELKGSVTAITAFAEEDPDTLPVPLEDALKQLRDGDTQAAEMILRDRIDIGRRAVIEGDSAADKSRYEKARQTAARAARNLAAFVLLRDPDEAGNLYDEATSLDDHDAALWRRNGDVKLLRGDLDGAQRVYQKALDLAGLRQETHQIAAATLGLGRVARRKRQSKKSIEILEDALEQARALNRRDIIGTAARNLGALYTRRQQQTDAIVMFKEALKADTMSSNPEGIAEAYEGMGRIAMQNDDLDEAERLMTQGFDSLKEAGSPPLPVASILRSLGEVHHKQADFEQADDALMAAVDFAESAGSEAFLADLLYECGVIYFDAGALDRAEKCHGRALILNQKLKRDRQIARQCWALGDVYKARHEYHKALVLGRQAEQLFRAAGEMESALSVTTWIGGVRAAGRI